MVNHPTFAGSVAALSLKGFIAGIGVVVAGLFVFVFVAGILISRSMYG